MPNISHSDGTVNFRLSYLHICAVFFLCGFLFFLGASLATKLIGGPALKQDLSLVTAQQDQFFSAAGTAKLSVVPDQAELSLGITSTQTTVTATQDEVNQTMNGLIDALTNLGIEKKNLKSTNYSVRPNYNWEVTPQTISGYTVTSSLEVTLTDFTKVNTVIDLATSQGINQVGNLSFTVSDAKRKELKTQAREIAIAEAKTNAEELAKLAGLTLGEIVGVYESELSGEGNYPVYAKSAYTLESAADIAPTSLEAGETELNYQVTLNYKTL